MPPAAAKAKKSPVMSPGGKWRSKEEAKLKKAATPASAAGGKKKIPGDRDLSSSFSSTKGYSASYSDATPLKKHVPRGKGGKKTWYKPPAPGQYDLTKISVAGNTNPTSRWGASTEDRFKSGSLGQVFRKKNDPAPGQYKQQSSFGLKKMNSADKNSVVPKFGTSEREPLTHMKQYIEGVDQIGSRAYTPSPGKYSPDDAALRKPIKGGTFGGKGIPRWSKKKGGPGYWTNATYDLPSSFSGNPVESTQKKSPVPRIASSNRWAAVSAPGMDPKDIANMRATNPKYAAHMKNPGMKYATHGSPGKEHGDSRQRTSVKCVIQGRAKDDVVITPDGYALRRPVRRPMSVEEAKRNKKMPKGKGKGKARPMTSANEPEPPHCYGGLIEKSKAPVTKFSDVKRFVYNDVTCATPGGYTNAQYDLPSSFGEGPSAYMGGVDREKMEKVGSLGMTINKPLSEEAKLPGPGAFDSEKASSGFGKQVTSATRNQPKVSFGSSGREDMAKQHISNSFADSEEGDLNQGSVFQKTVPGPGKYSPKDEYTRKPIVGGKFGGKGISRSDRPKGGPGYWTSATYDLPSSFAGSPVLSTEKKSAVPKIAASNRWAAVCSPGMNPTDIANMRLTNPMYAESRQTRPGPGEYPAPSSFGDGFQPSFGSLDREGAEKLCDPLMPVTRPLEVERQLPGPGQYAPNPSVGQQLLSVSKTSPAFKFGTGDRMSVEEMSGSGSPG